MTDREVKWRTIGGPMTRKELAEMDKKITEWSKSEAAEKLRAEKRAAGLPDRGFCWWMPPPVRER